MEFKGGEFGSGRITVDGGKFINCKFNGTILVYSGGELPKFDHCSFNNTGWFFDGAAGNTFQLMRVLHESPFKPVIENVIEYVTGKIEAPGAPE